jgi:hypothetical protein
MCLISIKRTTKIPVLVCVCERGEEREREKKIVKTERKKKRHWDKNEWVFLSVSKQEKEQAKYQLCRVFVREEREMKKHERGERENQRMVFIDAVWCYVDQREMLMSDGEIWRKVKSNAHFRRDWSSFFLSSIVPPFPRKPQLYIWTIAHIIIFSSVCLSPLPNSYGLVDILPLPPIPRVATAHTDGS